MRAAVGHRRRGPAPVYVDHERLGALERDIVRRAIFVYPWVRGATLYAGHFLTEHPVQAAVAGQLAKQAEAKQAAELGSVRGYAAGLFRVGGSGCGSPARSRARMIGLAASSRTVMSRDQAV